MSQEIEIRKRCICLRNNNEIWITEETYQKIKIAKEGASGSLLINISELDREVNTADIVEICTPDQMEDKRKIGRGEYKCVYNKWHKKRERCFCYKDKMDNFKRQAEITERKEQNKPLTAEQKKRRKKVMKDTRKWLEDKGVIPRKNETNDEEEKFFDKDIKHSKDGICVVCRKVELEKGLASVCGGTCKTERDRNPEKYKKFLK